MEGLTSNPFGEKPVPWWRTLRKSRRAHAPKRYTGAAGALGPLFGLVAEKGDGIDEPTRLAIFAGLTLVPPYLVELGWRRRERRRGCEADRTGSCARTGDPS